MAPKFCQVFEFRPLRRFTSQTLVKIINNLISISTSILTLSLLVLPIGNMLFEGGFMVLIIKIILKFNYI